MTLCTNRIHPALIAVVVAYGFQFDAEWVVPKRGVVVPGLLREMLRRLNDGATDRTDVVVYDLYQGSAPHD